jgi:hypothetical protein
MHRRTIASPAAVVLALVLAATTSSAHHSATVFDPDTMVGMNGVVTDFQFVNPHVLIFMTVTADDGSEQAWAGELTAPNRLQRMDLPVRWTRDILKPGDEIFMEGHPARNGAPAMDVITIIDASGVALIGGTGTRTRLNTN